MRTARLSSSLLCVFGLLLLGAVGVPSAAGTQERPREPFFPRSGNVGYDAKNYRVHLSYRPGSGWLDASVRIAAKAEQRLRRFSLDLVGLRVTKVTVNREAAECNRGRGKLKVRPARAIKKGARFVIEVSYQGRPQRITDPDGSQEGWYRTSDGALAVGEPVGTAAWLPSNNVPADKAILTIAITVPRGLTAVSNGRLLGTSIVGNRVRYLWLESSPMSTYLAVVDIGRGRLERTEAAGLPTWNLIDPRLEEGSRAVVDQLGEVIEFERGIFGPYPFDSAGSIVDYAPKLGYALETQSRPIYAFAPDLSTFVHETAHQWFGDSVGLQRWPNIWLNEGFATWTQWYYAERHSGRSARAIFNRLYRVPASSEELWEPPSGHPGTPQNLFATSTYVRGAMALEALRIKVGTKPMLKTLRRWATENRYGSADIEDFIALAEEVSGENLGPLFQRWLYKRGKP